MPFFISLVTPKNVCGCDDALHACMATVVLPLVPFLNPIGHDKPLANCRWTCDSTVRAPIAHAIKSDKYCGEMI